MKKVLIFASLLVFGFLSYWYVGIFSVPRWMGGPHDEEESDGLIHLVPGKLFRYGTLPRWMGGPKEVIVTQGFVNGFSVSVFEDVKTHDRTICFTAGNGLPYPVCRPSAFKGDTDAPRY